MKNVYDIRYEKNLIYVRSSEQDILLPDIPDEVYQDTVIMIYLYYEDTLSVYWPYIDGIPEEIDVCLISSREEVLEEARKHLEAAGRGEVRYILKENQGRDVSALLVTGADIIKDYKYICFLHDKKEHGEEWKKDTEFWIENLWGNMIGSAGYIRHILGLFLKHPTVGVLAPPEPVGDHFNAWYGYGWNYSFEITEELVRMLELNTDIRPQKPPITLGTVLWFKKDALQKLFQYGWKYSDFDDEGLKTPHYLSYGIERIFSYVAQDAGYDTGTVMTEVYAAKQANYLQHAVSLFLKEAEVFFSVTTLVALECFKRNQRRVIEFAKRNKEVYLYGAGKIGQLCLSVLRKENIQPAGFIVSKSDGNSVVECLPVIELNRLECVQRKAVIITVYELETRRAIAGMLEERGCHNYIVMLEEDH